MFSLLILFGSLPVASASIYDADFFAYFTQTKICDYELSPPDAIAKNLDIYLPHTRDLYRDDPKVATLAEYRLRFSVLLLLQQAANRAGVLDHSLTQSIQMLLAHTASTDSKLAALLYLSKPNNQTFDRAMLKSIFLSWSTYDHDTKIQFLKHLHRLEPQDEWVKDSFVNYLEAQFASESGEIKMLLAANLIAQGEMNPSLIEALTFFHGKPQFFRLNAVDFANDAFTGVSAMLVADALVQVRLFFLKHGTDAGK
jgi:hypothetical protein